MPQSSIVSSFSTFSSREVEPGAWIACARRRLPGDTRPAGRDGVKPRGALRGLSPERGQATLRRPRGRPLMILLIDNYDSFTFNLFHFLGDVGARCEVVRNDKLTVNDALARQPEAILLAPGPCTPSEAGVCLDLITAAAGKVPILGVCLGHQAIGQAFGGNVVRAPAPMHGKTSRIFHAGTDIFEAIPSPFTAT